MLREVGRSPDLYGDLVDVDIPRARVLLIDGRVPGDVASRHLNIPQISISKSLPIPVIKSTLCDGSRRTSGPGLSRL